MGASRRRPRGCRGLLPWPLAQEQLGSSRNWQFPLTSPDRAHRRRRLAKVACSANARLLLFLQAAASDARMGCGRRCRGARARARAPQKSPREYATAGWGLRGCAVGPSAPGNFRPIPGVFFLRPHRRNRCDARRKRGRHVCEFFSWRSVIVVHRRLGASEPHGLDFEV